MQFSFHEDAIWGKGHPSVVKAGWMNVFQPERRGGGRNPSLEPLQVLLRPLSIRRGLDDLSDVVESLLESFNHLLHRLLLGAVTPPSSSIGRGVASALNPQHEAVIFVAVTDRRRVADACPQNLPFCTEALSLCHLERRQSFWSARSRLDVEDQVVFAHARHRKRESSQVIVVRGALER